MNEDLDVLIFSETIDFSAVCRTCLGSDSLSPIFSSARGQKPCSTAILITMGVKVQKDDGLPQQMCAHCIYHLNNSMSFRKKCKEAERKLLQAKKQYDTNVKVKIEPDNRYKKHDDYSKTKIECEKTHSSHDVGVVVKCEVEIDEATEKDPQPPKKRKLSTKMEDTKHIQCYVCNKQLSIKSLNAHLMNNHPGADEQRIKCEYCDKNIRRDKMNRHVKMMHGLRKYQCKHCKSTFQSRNSLVVHLKANCVARKNKKSICQKNREIIECDLCHKTMQRASLKAHMNIQHAGLGPVCEHCGRRFGNKLRLSEHLRAKHGYEKFRCASCEFRCSSTKALENHERRHRGEKPFVCDACGAKFHAAYLLAQHRKSHNTERTVQCSQCPKVFKTRNGLSAHKLSVHGASRYRCLMCTNLYSCRHYAVKHLRTVHLFKGPIPPLQVLPESKEM